MQAQIVNKNGVKQNYRKPKVKRVYPSQSPLMCSCYLQPPWATVCVDTLYVVHSLAASCMICVTSCVAGWHTDVVGRCFSDTRQGVRVTGLTLRLGVIDAGWSKGTWTLLKRRLSFSASTNLWNDQAKAMKASDGKTNALVVHDQGAPFTLNFFGPSQVRKHCTESFRLKKKNFSFAQFSKKLCGGTPGFRNVLCVVLHSSRAPCN